MENEETEDSEVVPLLPSDDTETSCGIFGWRPQSLQTFAKPICILIMLNIYCFMEGTIVNGINVCHCLLD